MDSASKTKYRQTKAWKTLRERKIAEVKARDKEGKLRCELTGVVLRDRVAQVHHLNPEDYAGQNLDDFRVLSPMAHDFIEWIAVVRKDHWPNWSEWEKIVGPFLPVVVRKTDKYYKDIVDNIYQR